MRLMFSIFSCKGRLLNNYFQMVVLSKKRQYGIFKESWPYIKDTCAVVLVNVTEATIILGLAS